MKRWILCLVTFSLCAVWSACSPREHDDQWFERTSTDKELRDNYVDSQMDIGVSELNAKRSWQRDQMIGNTLGSWEGVTVSADQVHEMVEP